MIVVVGDGAQAAMDGDGLFFDPARRDDSGRHSADADRYSPPLSLWSAARARGLRAGVAKLSPALPDETLADLGDAVAFLSEDGVCKEACILHGDAAIDLPARCAILLPEGIVAGSGGNAPIARDWGAYLLDPDPALVRADALAAACAALDARRFSPDDAYLTADNPPAVGRWASAWRIREVHPYQPKALGKRLKALGIQSLIVKKRRFPLEPPALHKALALSGRGAPTATLVLIQTSDSYTAALCDPIPVV